MKFIFLQVHLFSRLLCLFAGLVMITSLMGLQVAYSAKRLGSPPRLGTDHTHTQTHTHTQEINNASLLAQAHDCYALL